MPQGPRFRGFPVLRLWSCHRSLMSMSVVPGQRGQGSHSAATRRVRHPNSAPRISMRSRAWIAALFVAPFLCCSILHSEGLSAADIIARSAQATQRDWEADPHYDCLEQDRTKDGSKTYEDLMIDGSPYQELVAVHGRPLPPAQQAEEKQKLQQTIARRKSETPPERAQRVAKYQENRKRDHALMTDLTKAFNFTLRGKGRLDGREVYVLDARPRPGYKPDSAQTQVLTGMKGRLWIDTKTFQWVRVEAEVIHPVSIDGFLARVEPGTRFELEKMPVADGVWLPKHFAMRSHARVLFVFGRHGSDDESYSQYRPQTQSF